MGGEECSWFKHSSFHTAVRDVVDGLQLAVGGGNPGVNRCTLKNVLWVYTGVDVANELNESRCLWLLPLL
jgi:hypothetical protein